MEFSPEVKEVFQTMKAWGLCDENYDGKRYKFPNILQICNLFNDYYQRIEELLSNKTSDTNTKDIVDSLDIKTFSVQIKYSYYKDIETFKNDYMMFVKDIPSMFHDICIKGLFLKVADFYYSYNGYDKHIVEKMLTKYINKRLE